MYADQERQIFRYRNGSLDAEGNLKMVCADPMVVWRKLSIAATSDGVTYSDLYERIKSRQALLQNTKDQPDADPEVVAKLNIDCAELLSQQAALLREAFSILPLSEDGSGLTESETMCVLYEFNEFNNELKKKHETMLASSASSAGPPVASAKEQILPPVDAQGTPIPTPQPHILAARPGGISMPRPMAGI